MSEGMSERTQVKEGLSASDGCNSGTCAAGTAQHGQPGQSTQPPAVSPLEVETPKLGMSANSSFDI